MRGTHDKRGHRRDGRTVGAGDRRVGPAQGTDAERGVLWTIAATALFVGSEAIAKLLSARYATVQVVWGRFFFHTCPRLDPWHALAGASAFTRPGLQLVRLALLVGANYFFFASLRTMALVDANVIMFLAPILTTALALAIPLLAERVRNWR